jgi:hypothetical protein
MAHSHIHTEADLDAALAALGEADPRFVPLIAEAGRPPLRRRSDGFAGLAAIIVAQQLSTASANAIWGRLAAAFEPRAAWTIGTENPRTQGNCSCCKTWQPTARCAGRTCRRGRARGADRRAWYRPVDSGYLSVGMPWPCRRLAGWRSRSARSSQSCIRAAGTADRKGDAGFGRVMATLARRRGADLVVVLSRRCHSSEVISRGQSAQT